MVKLIFVKGKNRLGYETMERSESISNAFLAHLLGPKAIAHLATTPGGPPNCSPSRWTRKSKAMGPTGQMGRIWRPLRATPTSPLRKPATSPAPQERILKTKGPDHTKLKWPLMGRPVGITAAGVDCRGPW